MKKFVTVVTILLLAATAGVFAQDTKEPVILIDFSSLADTDVDFGDVAGAGLPEADKALLKVDLSLANWEIDLSSSSQVGDNQALSYVKPATTITDSKVVMGIRIHFPEANFNSYAIVKPPFDIPAYEDKPGDPAGTGNKFTGKGIMKNVGNIKFIEITVNGRNYPHGIGIIIEDQSGAEKIIFIDYLRYAGWKTLVWQNPNYITEVKNREMRSTPLYPRSQPFLKLKGLIIYKDASSVGGDFVTYIKDIKIAFDEAQTSEYELDINDEALWNIIQDREQKRTMAEMKRLGNVQVLRYLEKKKQYDGRDPAEQ